MNNQKQYINTIQILNALIKQYVDIHNHILIQHEFIKKQRYLFLHNHILLKDFYILYIRYLILIYKFYIFTQLLYKSLITFQSLLNHSQHNSILILINQFIHIIYNNYYKSSSIIKSPFYKSHFFNNIFILLIQRYHHYSLFEINPQLKYFLKSFSVLLPYLNKNHLYKIKKSVKTTKFKLITKTQFLDIIHINQFIITKKRQYSFRKFHIQYSIFHNTPIFIQLYNLLNLYFYKSFSYYSFSNLFRFSSFYNHHFLYKQFSKHTLLYFINNNSLIQH